MRRPVDGPHRRPARSLLRRGLSATRSPPPRRRPGPDVALDDVHGFADRAAASRPTAISAQPYLSGWDPDPLVRRVLGWVIGQRAGANDVYVLTKAMKDEDELVRARAAAALGRITDAKTLAPLTEALHDPKPRVRANAATALGRTAPADLHTRLADSLADPHPAVRAAATAALRPATTHVANRRTTSDGPDAGR
ncbi:MAG TPA: HEAT repeat domain-containing protein [Kutzneria sp.]